MMKRSSKVIPRLVPTAPLVRSACWLCPDVLLAVNTEQSGAVPPTVLLLDGNRSTTRCKAKRLLALDAGPQARIILSVFVLPKRRGGTVYLEFPSKRKGSATLIEAPNSIEGFRALLMQHLAPLSADDRHQVLAMLASVSSEHDKRGCPKLCESLLLAREALRQRLPEVQITADVHRGLTVDSLFAIDERSFYIRGWASMASGVWMRLTVVSPEGARVELAERAFWHRRPDVDKFYRLSPDETAERKCGFLCFFELPSPSTKRKGWILEAVDDAGEAAEVAAPEVCPDIQKTRQCILGDLQFERLPLQDFRIRQVLPAITRLQERHQGALRIASVRQYGTRRPAPDVSVIIPLYRRVDFLEHQLAQFVYDPELWAADLIYVLDSPELADGLSDYAAALFDVYRVPFRLAVLQSNGGYAAANNLGASLARGRQLVLLNSDILPDQPGWLGRMMKFYDSKPDIGALGIQMLYEDDILQHAGLYFDRSPISVLWDNKHYFQGLDRQLPAANVTRQTPAVCGACLMIARELFQQLGGLRGVYVQGGYEDSDLCLRLRELGRAIWYLPEVKVYHLEGQSYGSQDRACTSDLNRWLHTRFWDRQIEALMGRPEFTKRTHG